VVGVVTGNDAMNAAMLAVNQRPGFRPVATWTDAGGAQPSDVRGGRAGSAANRRRISLA
jgi:hypothetical protein